MPPLDATHGATPAAGDALLESIDQPLTDQTGLGIPLLDPLAERLRDPLALAQRAEPAAEPLKSTAFLAARLARTARQQHVERGIEAPTRHARVVNGHGIAAAELLGGLAEPIELPPGVRLDGQLRDHIGSADSRGFA